MVVIRKDLRSIFEIFREWISVERVIGVGSEIGVMLDWRRYYAIEVAETDDF